MFNLFKKEINGFFSSLTGYVVIIVFLLTNSAFIWLFENPLNILQGGYASLDPLFELAPWVFLFLVPAITMRMIAEERRSGTLDLLLTRPVREGQIIVAKFLASWALILLSLLPTLAWVWSVYTIGSPRGNLDLAGTWGSFLGLFFLGGIYAAIGILASSVTGNQIVAFILAVAGSFLMFRGFEYLADTVGSGKTALMISKAGIAYHYSSMSRGVIDSRDLVYFAVTGALFIQAARLVLKARNRSWRTLGETAVILAVFVLALVISGLGFFRIDLTSENIYTLSPSSKKLLRDLDSPVTVRIYLDGEMPSEFVNFRDHIEDLMEECRAYAGGNLRYEFVNLYDVEDEALRNRMIGELYDKGLKVTSVQMKDREGGTTARILFPGAMVSCGDYTVPVNLLRNNPALTHEVNLNNSIQTLEYEFMRAIHSLTLKDIPRIAFIEGQGELDSLQTSSLMNELKNFFQVDRGFISGNLEALLNYRAIIIAQPLRPFSERDKFAIDQYIMRGGKVLFFLDPVNPYADSLTGGTTVALARPVGLEDLLFRYGIRINYNLVADLQCSPVPVNTAAAGEQARFTLLPWVYNPLLAGPQDNPVTRGLNYVKGEYVSSLDTVGDPGSGMKRTVLLSTSGASRAREVPLYISMEEVTVKPDPALYHASHLPVAVWMEGEFPSFFRNYPVPEGVEPPGTRVVEKSVPTSVLVVADGDIPANGVSFSEGAWHAEPLGYDRYTRQTFGNLEFVMNVISLMTDDTGIMDLRSREFRLRLLDREITGRRNQMVKWKVINTVLPVLLTVLAGLLIVAWRKRKYSH
jgi:ABC-2 type transport system permease protein